ncbi:MAG: hypothetical protein IKG84_10320 [Bacteroidales bacterium]|nr:hypothetical protein [Bacteroidales bacterium]MBR6846888.1 hypothetical protein [Bacteroidales bacterium]
MKLHKLIIHILIIALLLLLHEPLFAWWCDTGIGKFIGSVKPTLFNDCMALAIGVLGGQAALIIPKRLSNEGNGFSRVVAGYLLFIILVQSITFNDCFIHAYSAPWFRYTDMLVPFLLVFWVASWIKSKDEKISSDSNADNGLQLLYDDTDEADFLNRGERLKHICKFLRENKGNAKCATGVAITGGWGAGKSWVLEHVKKHMEQEEEICIDFKPWVYGETDITRQFYLTLERELKSQNYKVKELKDAVLEMDNDKLSGMGRATLSLMGVVTKSQGRSNAIDKVKKRLLEYNRQIYVFIDDCDRLAREELLQVLSLIRNTGDFPLVTYLMAFDEQVVRKSLKDEDGIQYVAKMFNLTEVLPPVTNDTIAHYLMDSIWLMLGVNEMNENPFARIPIAKYLPTVREAKKYLNLLRADYAHLKERIDKYLFYTEDFFLLELLKYKYPNLYFELRVNPKKYLRYERDGWNSPVGLPNENAFDDEDDQLALMKALFRKMDVFSDKDSVVGVANREYFQLYFDEKTTKRYVDGNEFMDSVKNGTLYQSVGEWIDDGCSGVIELLCTVYAYVSRRQLFLSMVEYIWHQCENSKAENTVSKLTYGYDTKEYKHGYKSISALIAETPQIKLLTFQHLPEPGESISNENNLEKLIDDSNRTMELMGIGLNALRHTRQKDYPYEEIMHYVDLLWNKLISELPNDAMSTLNVIDIWADCTSEDTFERMILPLIKAHPQRWLGATVTTIKHEEKKYYLLKSRGTHAIFGSRARISGILPQIIGSARDEDKDYVVAYANLVDRLDAILDNEEVYSVVGRMEVLMEGIEATALPALADGIMIGLDLSIPIEAAFNQLRDTPFWKGDDLRIRRESPQFYFKTDI